MVKYVDKTPQPKPGKEPTPTPTRRPAPSPVRPKPTPKPTGRPAPTVRPAPSPVRPAPSPSTPKPTKPTEKTGRPAPGTKPGDGNGCTPKVVAEDRFCTGYTMNIYNLKTIDECMAAIKKKDPNAKFFMYRTERNHHCSACPSSYTGDAVKGT
jgi:outer membrane biosynthesis protein TonB